MRGEFGRRGVNEYQLSCRYYKKYMYLCANLPSAEWILSEQTHKQHWQAVICTSLYAYVYSMNDAAPIFSKHCVVITSVSKEVCQKSVKRDYWRIAPEEIRVFIIDVSRYLKFLLCLDFPIYLINVTFDQHRPTCTLYQYVSVESTDECDPVWSIFSIHWKKVAFFRARILTALKC